MICNPEWKEIREQIAEYQNPPDRPDVVVRMKEYLVAYLHGFTWLNSRSGVYHTHILIILAEEDKPRARDLSTSWCLVKFPRGHKPGAIRNGNELHDAWSVWKSKPQLRLHGYPKPLVEVSRANVDGYAEVQRCRRPPGKQKFKTREYDNAMTNQWVVPYNPYLSQKYNCHINIEKCTGITVVKYMYKYVYKGSDKAMFTIESVENDREGGTRVRVEPNEIIRYLNARYISPVEACIRLLDYVVQGKSHLVVLLPVHLKGKHIGLFRVNEDPEEVLERTNHSMLTSFFELCASDDPVNQIVKTMLYQDIPKKFTWKNGVRRTRFQAAIGRMIHVSPRDMERFYLRLMLCNRRGPTSFEDLRTVRGIEYPSYLDPAKAAGHLENDGEWIVCMEEAREYKIPYQLRQQFATLLAYSKPTDVRGMWNQFYTDLSEDYAHTFRVMSEPHKSKTVLFKTLLSLQLLLEVSGYAVADSTFQNSIRRCYTRAFLKTALFAEN
ncbi:Helitron helicase [Phytophthora megakarya]|uniref:Helitron helicase n=1 Tax=Phytophthora megakarya TaxID=4795 RepID=A0A225UXS3_9STRA|nr:Helitron helicase [Phytophthora megakarya]